MLAARISQGTSMVLKNSNGRVAVSFEVDGTLTDASGNVTVTIVDKELGTTLVDAQTATNLSTGVYYYDLGTSNTSRVRRLKATWSGSFESTSQSRDLYYEVVGGYLFTEKQIRSFDQSQLSSTTTYTDEMIRDERARVTELLYDWTGINWIERYGYAELQGENSIQINLPDRQINEIISCTITGVSQTVSDLKIDKSLGIVYHKDGTFTFATRAYPLNVVFEYSNGYTQITDGVDRIAMKLVINNLVASQIVENARSFSDNAGQIDLILEGGPQHNRTRIPEVNAWLDQHSQSIVIY